MFTQKTPSRLLQLEGKGDKYLKKRGNTIELNVMSVCIGPGLSLCLGVALHTLLSSYTDFFFFFFCSRSSGSGSFTQGYLLLEKKNNQKVPCVTSEDQTGVGCGSNISLSPLGLRIRQAKLIIPETMT